MKLRETQRLDRKRSCLKVDFETDEDLEARIDKGDRLGWIIRLEERLEEGDSLSVVLNGKTRSVRLETRVTQIFRSGQDLHGTMLEVLSRETVSRGTVSEATGAIQPREASRTPERSGDSTEEPAERPQQPGASQFSGETLGVSAMFDIKKLDPQAKARLAAKATRQQRMILLRESSAQIGMSLLNNPQLEPAEVLELAKNPQSASGLLQRIGQDRRWAGNYEIQLALVKNPRTPSPLALRFVDLLRKGDLRDLAKSQALRENIRKAILRLYLARS